MTPKPDFGPPRLPAFDRFVEAVGVIGGLLCLAAAVTVTTSVLGRWLSDTSLGETFGIGPIPGDFELVQIAIAVAVFCFLPICQLKRANIFVDTFTSRLPVSWNASIDAAWDFALAGIVAVLAYDLALGTLDALASGQNSMVLQIPLGPVLALCSGLIALLAATAVVTGLRLLRARP